jgi:rod shape-determining protein MreD
MFSLLHLILFAVSIVLQVTIAPLFSIREVAPDFILITVIAISLQKGKAWGVIAGFLGGVLFDSFGTGMLGLSSLTKTIAAFIAGVFVGERLARSFGAIAGFLFIVLLIHDTMYFFITSIGTAVTFWTAFFKYALPTTLYTLTFMVMAHLLWPRLLWGKAT